MLILSEFTGAVHQLSEAVLVNPFDVVGVKAAILGALEMAPDEQRQRMLTLQRSVRRFDARWWARQFLSGARPVSDLAAAVARLGEVPALLVACDYDGTLAELVDDPDQAVPEPAAIAALAALATLPGTHVAVISGRARRDLVRLSGLDGVALLIGSHGAERDGGLAGHLRASERAALAELGDALAALADRHPGAWVEHKPAAAVLHYRTVDAGGVDALLAEAEAWLAGHPDVRVLRGKQVVECMVELGDVHIGKGHALAELRARWSVDATLFVGDDLTDEHAFAVLGDGDVGVKVGPGPSAARWRVATPAAVAALLGDLLDARS